MRIGYLLDTHKGGYDGPVPDRNDAVSTMEAILEEAQIAEASGFHSLQVPDRHGRPETHLPGAMQLLTILARETERVAIGSYALVNTVYHPMDIAQRTAVIDNLSRGRLYMTYARGYHEGYWNQFGVDHDRMLGRFLSNLKVQQIAFQGERFSYADDFYRVVDGLVTPQPYQQPSFPVWGGGQFTASIRRCAEYAACWTGDAWPIDKATWLEQVRPYRERCEEVGKTPFVVLLRCGWVGSSYEEIERMGFLDRIVSEFRFYAERGLLSHHPEFSSPSDITAKSLRPHVLAGSASEVIEKIEKLKDELGVDYVSMRLRLPTGPDFALVREQLARFGEEVAGHFNRADPAIDHPAIPEGARW
jgi:alkanesulfonate monooxygenase SsuD/methylene tetrahydromethanopterin reductase-like flavin-dependent oxidoreductase (luciferase family)